MHRLLMPASGTGSIARRLLAILRDLVLATVAAAIFSVALATIVHSTEAPPRKTVRDACLGDVRTLCSGIMPGEGRIKRCMVEKYEQLSDGCKTAIRESRAQATSK